MAVLFTSSKFSATDAAGRPLSAGRVYTYAAGTLTPKATYTDQAGLSSNTNPVLLDSQGRASIWLGSGSYRFVVRDASDVLAPDGDVDNIRSSESILADFQASLQGATGAAQVGVADAGSYFNSTTVEAALQELVAGTQFAASGVNVLRYIPPAEWPAITAGTSTTDLKTYLQSALTAEPNLVWPDGLYNTSGKLIPRTDGKIRGINRRGARLKGTSAITLLEYPIANFDTEVAYIRFQGSGCTGISVATTAGTLQGYLASPNIHDCDFDWDLAFGINADCIFARIERSTFGVYPLASPPAPGTSTFVGLKSVFYPATTNYTNLNVVRDCIFQNGGNASVATVQLTSGASWLFENCDWEKGGIAVDARDVHLLEFSHCWFEACVSASGPLFRIDGGSGVSRTTVRHSNFTGNTVDRIFQYTSGFVQYLDITDCLFGLSASTSPIYDNNTTLRTRPGNGSIGWDRNIVTGGLAGNKLVTGLSAPSGPGCDQWAVVNTASSGTLLGSSDPNASIVRNSTGTVTVTFSNPFCSSTSTGGGTANAQTGPARVAGVGSTSSIQVQCTTFAGAAQDDVFFLKVFGK